MFLVFVLLILALLAKDATPLGDRYILRGASEGLALLVGGGWIALSGLRILNWQHMLLGLYIMALFLAVPFVLNPLYVSLQVLAVVAVMLFSLAFMDAAEHDPHLLLKAARTMFLAIAVVCLGSLALKAWHPGLAYEDTFEGLRFRGLFGKPAMMGTASGLLLGLSLFLDWNWFIRACAFAVALPCLYLTGSRTYWIAAAISIIIVGIRYVRWRWMFVPIGAVLFVIALCIGILGDIHFTSQKQAQIFRQDSIETLSGRTAIWTEALNRYREHPWLGFGFTAGGVAAGERNRPGAVSLSSQFITQGSVTLHNGYLQALLDSGAIGGGLYVSVIGLSLVSLLLYDKAKRHAPEFYSLLFLAFANLGETVIFGAGVLHGVWYWYVTVLALTLPSLTKVSSISPKPDENYGISPVASKQVPRRFPIAQSKKAWS